MVDHRLLEELETMARDSLTTSGAAVLLANLETVPRLCRVLQDAGPAGILQEAAADVALSLGAEVCRWQGGAGVSGRWQLEPLPYALAVCAGAADADISLRALTLRALARLTAAGVVPSSAVASIVVCVARCAQERALLSASTAVLHALCVTADGRQALLQHQQLPRLLRRCLQCAQSKSDVLACSALLFLAQETPVRPPRSSPDRKQMPAAIDHMAALLWPMTVSKFVSECWQQQPVLFAAGTVEDPHQTVQPPGGVLPSSVAPPAPPRKDMCDLLHTAIGFQREIASDRDLSTFDARDDILHFLRHCQSLPPPPAELLSPTCTSGRLIGEWLLSAFCGDGRLSSLGEILSVANPGNCQTWLYMSRVDAQRAWHASMLVCLWASVHVCWCAVYASGLVCMYAGVCEFVLVCSVS